VVRYLPFLINLFLSIYALFSCIQTRDEDVPHLPKLIWILLIVLVPFVGPITWILMSRSHLRRQSAGGPSGGPDRGRSGPAPRRPAPDDDPEFLAWLDRDRRRTDRDRSTDKPVPNEDKPTDTTDEPGEPGEGPDDGESGDRAR